MASGYERQVLAKEVAAKAAAVKEKAERLPPSSEAADLRDAIKALMMSVVQLESTV